MSDLWAEVLAAWEESGREGSPWRPGMLAHYRFADSPAVFVNRIGDDMRADGCLVPGPEAGDVNPITWRHPDPDDPATLGALLGLVRDVWGEPEASAWAYRGGVGWEVTLNPGAALPRPALGFGATEYEALCRALIAGLRRGAS